MRAPAESHPSLRSGLLRSASRRHLRAAALRPRSRPPLAIRRPSTTIRQDRSRSQALRSRHRRPCRAPARADSFLHSRPVAFAPLPHLRAVRSRPTPRVTLRRRWAADARSRCTARASAVSVACPCGLPDCSTCAGWRSAARAPSPVRASRYCSLRCAPPCATVLIVGIPPGRPIFGSARVGVRVARPATMRPRWGASEQGKL